MPLDLVSLPPFIVGPMSGGVVVVRLTAGAEIPPDIRAALACADIVFCDEGAERGFAASVGPSTLVECVPDDGGRAWWRPSVLARAGRLAGDGWRVVWVASAKSELPGDFAPMANSTRSLAGEFVTGGPDAPHPLATAFNGLAG
jgi:hypothetical protein